MSQPTVITFVDIGIVTLFGISIIQLISSLCTGDTHLGGEDFDQRVMDHFIKLYKKKKGKDLRKDVRAVQKLRREVEKAKRALSAAHQVCHYSKHYSNPENRS